MTLDLRKPEIAYLFGLLQTDGSHYGSTNSKGKVSLELGARDIATLKVLQRVLPCYSSLTLRSRGTNFADNHESAVLAFFDQGVRRELEQLGLPPGRKSLTIGPPESVYSRRDYLRGLLDGDGSVGWTASGSPFVSFVTASERLSGYVEEEIREVTGAVRRTRRNSRDGVFNVMVRNGPAVTLAKFCWGGDAWPSLARKKASAGEIASWQPKPGTEHRFGTRRRAWSPDEDDVVISCRVADAAEILDRSHKSVGMRRWRLQQDRLTSGAPEDGRPPGAPRLTSVVLEDRSRL